MNKDFIYIYIYIYIYMYDCLFYDLYVRVPFEDFTISVPRILKVASTQLHLNGWTTIMKALHALCLYSLVLVTPRLFLHYFCSRLQDKTRWISLIRLLKHLLFCPFTSYKNFQNWLLQGNNKASRWEEFFLRLVREPSVSFLLETMPSMVRQVPKGAFEHRRTPRPRNTLLETTCLTFLVTSSIPRSCFGS
ncbi:hypothetical protein GLYMA_03G027100v4 [Glycine max]|nr:hypothetical protein GLYMA_03G027100v4 [Glycine max]KAG4393153.1 hypothetical protein GLYMA_03G027100v4 [Glycine max]